MSCDLAYGFVKPKISLQKNISFILFVYTIIVYTFVKKNMKANKPKCGCGNTQNPDGYCDGSHAR